MNYLTVAQVAERLQSSQANIYALIEQKELGCIRIGANGGGIRISDVQLDAFIESRREHPGKDAPFPDTNPTKPYRLKHVR